MKLPAHIALTGRKRAASASDRTPVYAMVGNPNCGKTTLFNALTGLRQKVGNYPGVTVEKKMGSCELPSGRRVDVLDLPGSYSLRPGSPDEMIVRDVLFGLRPDTPSPDLVVFVMDATKLDRHLFLALQVLELGRPVVVAPDAGSAVHALQAAGLQILATTVDGEVSLDDAELAGPTAWLFGGEAHGLPAELAELADTRVTIPMSGGAQSLNVAAAAAICLYQSSRAQV